MCILTGNLQKSLYKKQDVTCTRADGDCWKSQTMRTGGVISKITFKETNKQCLI